MATTYYHVIACTKGGAAYAWSSLELLDPLTYLIFVVLGGITDTASVVPVIKLM